MIAVVSSSILTSIWLPQVSSSTSLLGFSNHHCLSNISDQLGMYLCQGKKFFKTGFVWLNFIKLKSNPGRVQRCWNTSFLTPGGKTPDPLTADHVQCWSWPLLIMTSADYAHYWSSCPLVFMPTDDYAHFWLSCPLPTADHGHSWSSKSQF